MAEHDSDANGASFFSNAFSPLSRSDAASSFHVGTADGDDAMLPSTAWLDAHALDDACVGAAYESVSARERAALKLCIARLHAIYGESAARERRRRCFRQGFCLEEEEVPAPFALVVCEAAYRWPSAFLAAVMPALLAGVTRVLPCFLPSGRDADGCAEPRASLLAALELAGVERSFTAGEEEAQSLLRDLAREEEGGCLVLLGERSFAESLLLTAHRSGVAGIPLVRPPLAGAHAPREGLRTDFLFLDAAHHFVWVWPDLPPSCFRRRRMRLFSS